MKKSGMHAMRAASLSKVRKLLNRYLVLVQQSRAAQDIRCFRHLGEIVDQRGRPVGRYVLPFQDVFLPLKLADLPLQRINVLAPRLLVRVGRLRAQK